MPMWLGEAPEWVKDRIRVLEPFMREHAENNTRRYFEQHRNDATKLARGPAIESMFEFFIGRDADVAIEEIWAPDRCNEVLAYLQIKYAIMVIEEYSKHLLSLRNSLPA